MRLGLTWKIFLGTALVVLIILASTLAVTSVLAGRAADTAVDRGLSQTNEQVGQILRARDQGLSNGAKVFAQQPAFLGALERSLGLEDYSSLYDQSREAAQQIGADWVQITDAEGMRLAKSDDAGAENSDLSESSLVGGALEGEDRHGFGLSDGRLFQAVAVPVRKPAGAQLGTLMAIRAIDDSLARSVQTATNTEVLFYAIPDSGPPTIAASSAGIARGPALDAFVERLAADSAQRDDTGAALATPDSTAGAATLRSVSAPAPARSEVELGGTHYVGQSTPLLSAGGQPVGGFIALRNRDVELAAFTRLRNAILMAGVAGLLVAFLLSWIIARQISRPVKALVVAARKAADGDYTTDIRTKSRDEVGSLATAFNALLEDLRDKQALVDFMGGAQGDQRTVPMAAVSGTARQQLASAGGAMIEPGKTFAGRYEIKEVLGVGGMGMVYKAVDRELGETIAIKTLKQDFMAQDATALERFREEIRLARRISHRNVVRTHDIGELSGVYYITMEYVQGESLKDLIRARGRLPIPVVLTVGKQLARALEVAHEQGVIHRDIKPQNIVVEANGVLKVMDFGIARLAERKDGVTQAGMIVGTPEYMAPEQLLGDPLDARADIYAAGCVLYECLTGAPPFNADSPITLITKVLEETPAPPQQLNSEAPAKLSDLVLKAISRDRDSRVKSATELHDRLAEIG